jgi:formate hydrogenlyase subunit 4
VTHLVALAAQLLHLLLLPAAAPLALGASRAVAARLAGRAGPPVLQPWRDLLRLWRKQAVFAETASGLFEAAPAVAFAASWLAAALVPSFALGMAGAPVADLLVVAGLLLLARATLALAAMESGTALGGLGASRSMALTAFTEPALLLAVLPLALLVGTTNLDVMLGVLREGAVGLRVPLVLAVAALGVVAAARLRSEDPPIAPFAEAAMADDALGQEYAGRHLALLHWGAALRRLLWLGLLADLAAPFGLADAVGNPLGWLVGLIAWVGKVAVLTVALALWQSLRAGRAARPAEVFGAAVLLGLLAAAFLFAGQGLA